MTRARDQANPLTAVVAVGLLAGPAAAQPPSEFADALLGRWDVTVQGADGAYPSWLEVRLRTEGSLMGRFVGRVGSARYVSDLSFDSGRLTFTVPVQYETGVDELRFEGTLTGEHIAGMARVANGATARFTAARAPVLATSSEPSWGDPVALFNGRDLTGWMPRGSEHAGCWRVEDGVLAATPPCVDLMTSAKFDELRLHAEFRFPAGSNSGVYLRGRYEVQIQDDAGKALDALRIGGVYGFITPTAAAARGAGEWQTLDVELVGRRVTVQLNGLRIVDGQEIPGITGGALDSNEGEPGPIMLQGDHGPIEFRALTLARATIARAR